MLAGSVSDHCGLLIDIQRSVRNVKVPFRFFNMWIDHPKFFRIVERIWSLQMHGSNMYKIYCKLKLLRAINRRDFDKISL